MAHCAQLRNRTFIQPSKPLLVRLLFAASIALGTLLSESHRLLQRIKLASYY